MYIHKWNITITGIETNCMKTKYYFIQQISPCFNFYYHLVPFLAHCVFLAWCVQDKWMNLLWKIDGWACEFYKLEVFQSCTLTLIGSPESQLAWRITTRITDMLLIPLGKFSLCLPHLSPCMWEQAGRIAQLPPAPPRELGVKVPAQGSTDMLRGDLNRWPSDHR